MHLPVKSAEKFSDYGSYDEIAKALIGKFPDIDRRLAPRSLGAKIGDLDRGSAAWWTKRLQIAERLAQLLDIPLADLGLHGPAGSQFFAFAEFPALPPLDLKREKPCLFGVEQLDPAQRRPERFGRETLDNWLDSTPRSIRRPPSEMEWLCIPDDLELQLLSKRLGVAGPYDVVFAETLADAGDRLLSEKPLVISVRADGGDDGLMALARRPRDAGTLVIAPFMQPVREETSSAEYLSWERLTTRGLERLRIDLTAPGRSPWGGGLNRWTWTLFPDWRYQLLEWVEERLNRRDVDTLFSAQGMKAWLDRFDPRGEWFCTTTDMMHLCQMGHYKGNKLPAPNDPSAGSKLVQSLFKTEPSAQSVRIKQLAETRWNRRDLSWRGELPRAAWLSLAATGEDIPSKSELEAIARGKTPRAREKAADELASKLKVGNLDALLSSGLLKESRRGHFNFQHRTLATLVVRDDLIRQIAQEPLATWALFCFDPDRRPVVDAALDAVSIGNLADAAERLDQESKDSAVAIGASEALFMAVGRRIAEDEEIPPILMSVARIVLDRLDLTSEWNLPEPWSRPAESQDEQLDWISACWAWSLMPDVPTEMPATWLFPGWGESLPERPVWLATLWPEEEGEQISPAWRRFLSVVDQWVKDLEQPVAYAPISLRIGLLGKAARGASPADPALWQFLIGNNWAEAPLLERFKRVGKEAATRLWPSFLVFERNLQAEEGFRVRFSHVRRWLLEQLKPADALKPLGEDDLRYLASIPETLPPAFRGPLLQLLVRKSLSVPHSDALPFIRRFGSAATSALDSYLDHENLGRAAAECLWAWDPEKAERFLRSEKLGTQARSNILDACPANRVAAAASVLFDEPTLFDLSVRTSWARKHLPMAGASAERLIAIMQRD